MKKDLFDYIIEPTDKEYRKENIIDDISLSQNLASLKMLILEIIMIT